MNYSLKCPLCSQSITIDAESDDAAVERLLTEGKDHMKKHHPQLPAMADDQMKAMIRLGMKKEG